MQTPGEVLVHSLYSTLDPKTRDARRAEVLRIPNPSKRAAGLALHELAVRRPKIAAAMIGLRYRLPALQYVGSGGESTVFKLNKNEVLKINRSSVHMSPRQRREFEAQKRHEHELMAEALGDFVVPQTSSLRGDPMFRGQEVLAIQQSFEDITDPAIMEATEPQVMAQAIEEAQVQAPDITEQLTEFSERSYMLYSSSRQRLVPDILGLGNLVFTSGNSLSIRLVDGQPIGSGPDGSTLQLAALARLDMLNTALALVS